MELEGGSIGIFEFTALHVLPGCLNNRNATFIKRLNVGLSQITQLLPRHHLPLKLLGLDLLEHLLP